MSMLEKDIDQAEVELSLEDVEEDDDTLEAEAEEAAFERALNREERKHYQSLDATQIYLNEIGFSPLLKPEEEVYFGRLAQAGDPAGRSA